MSMSEFFFDSLNALFLPGDMSTFNFEHYEFGDTFLFVLPSVASRTVVLTLIL